VLSNSVHRIVKYFEPTYYLTHRRNLSQIFAKFADLEEDGEKVMSDKGFIEFGHQNKLFSRTCQEEFLSKAAKIVLARNAGLRDDFG
jgi:hypothetical protein